MFRTPRLTILAMVFSAICIALIYHHWPQIKAGQYLPKKKQQFITEFRKISREIASERSERFDEVSLCQCLSEPTDTKLFTVEDPVTCRPDTLKLQKTFEAMPAVFRERRSSPPTDFPRLCMIYALKQNTYHKHSTSSCFESQPLCISEEYVNIMYNSFGEVMSCLKVPQKEVFPYLFFRTRLQINAEKGVASLDIKQIQQLRELLKKKVDEITRSDDPACVRISPLLKELNFDDSQKCFLTQTPDNPLMSFFILGVLFRMQQESIVPLLEPLEVREKLKKFGRMDSDHEQLKITLTLASLFYGQEKTKSLFQNYLMMAADGQSFKSFVIAENPKDDFFTNLIAVMQELNREFKEGTCVSESFLVQ